MMIPSLLLIDSYCYSKLIIIAISKLISLLAKYILFVLELMASAICSPFNPNPNLIEVSARFFLYFVVFSIVWKR
jgi:hypothetical protein